MTANVAAPTITRLQLGVSQLENLDPRVLDVFLDKSWMHFGARHVTRPTLAQYLRRHSFGYLLRNLRYRIALRLTGRKVAHKDPDSLYERTHFEEFFFEKGGSLPFADASLDFVFSEHFFEHLFFDEAMALLRECHRILKPRGVIRIIVPDADLRTYDAPEQAGFPDVKLPVNDPDKHKTRWSVYLLAEALALAGFEPVPLRYCDKHGTYVQRDPATLASTYDACPEQQLTRTLSYVRRLDSLIVDGINPA